MYRDLRSYYTRNGFVKRTIEILELIEQPEFTFSNYTRWQIIRRLYTACFEFRKNGDVFHVMEYENLISQIADRIDLIENSYQTKTENDVDYDNQIIDEFIVRAKNELSIRIDVTGNELSNILNEVINEYNDTQWTIVADNNNNNVIESNNTLNANNELTITNNEDFGNIITQTIDEYFTNNTVAMECDDDYNNFITPQNPINNLLNVPNINEEEHFESGYAEETFEFPEDLNYEQNNLIELTQSNTVSNNNNVSVSTCEFNDTLTKSLPLTIDFETDIFDLANVNNLNNSYTDDFNNSYTSSFNDSGIAEESDGSISSFEQEKFIIDRFMSNSFSENMDCSMDLLQSSFDSFDCSNEHVNISSNLNQTNDNNNTQEINNEHFAPTLEDYFPNLNDFGHHWNINEDASQYVPEWNIDLINNLQSIKCKNILSIDNFESNQVSIFKKDSEAQCSKSSNLDLIQISKNYMNNIDVDIFGKFYGRPAFF